MAHYTYIEDGIEKTMTDEEHSTRLAEEKVWNDKETERAWAKLRRDRDAKLSSTDWRASSDLTISDAWKKYRQDLRDLPSTLNDASVVKAITWPTEPI